jgi:mono/diheme cytochrome c family protein
MASRPLFVSLALLVVGVAGCGDSTHTSPDGGHAAHSDPLAHCKAGYAPDRRDEAITSNPDIVVVNAGNPDDPNDDIKDTLLPRAVIAWMEDQGWQQEHDDWHNIRRWDQNCRRSNAPAEGCASAQRLVARGLWRAPIQEGAPGDGYDFLVMHRHMIQGLKQAFPKHADLFAGFRKVPRQRADSDNPMPWRDVRWSEAQLKAIDKLEHIEQHLDEFPTEDELALYMQAPYRWTPESPTRSTADPSNGIHFSLHAQWSIAGSPAPLGNGQTNIDNFVFWKLHGWLDDVWQRYRQAKGIRDDDPKYLAALYAQCREMHDLDELNLKPPAATKPADGGASPAVERGVFAQTVRPIFDRACGLCHGATGQSAALTLGGSGVNSAEIVKGLVGVRATNGNYDLVAPGDPAKSWLYLKLTGESATVACERACNRGVMPPAGTRLTASEIESVRAWIASGAPAPTP